MNTMNITDYEIIIDYEIGDSVFFFNEGDIIKGEICEINLMKKRNSTKITYGVEFLHKDGEKGHTFCHRVDIFKTIDGLVKNLLDNYSRRE